VSSCTYIYINMNAVFGSIHYIRQLACEATRVKLMSDVNELHLLPGVPAPSYPPEPTEPPSKKARLEQQKISPYDDPVQALDHGRCMWAFSESVVFEWACDTTRDLLDENRWKKARELTKSTEERLNMIRQLLFIGCLYDGRKPLGYDGRKPLRL
jgi:hypothetical protein